MIRTIAVLAGMVMIGCVAALAWGQQAGETTVTIDQVQAAGISGFRAFWDTPVVLGGDGASEVVDKSPFGKGPSAVWSPAKRDGGAKPGALAFDAVHRSLLLRFPTAAERIAEQVGNGLEICKVELVLPYRDHEFWPEGYAEPSGMSFLGEQWASTPPTWHAVAWALRRPWAADKDSGPTFNAFINGRGYWRMYGAQDTQADRFPQQFGPTEVSYKAPEGRMDITAMVNDAAFGENLGQRLRALAEQGVIVRKWETYDARYLTGGYEWGVSTGGRGILIQAPKLVVTFGPAKQRQQVTLPAATDVRALGERLAQAGEAQAGKPTAVMPSAEQIKAMAAKHGLVRPDRMADWQWQRVQELSERGGFHAFPDTPEAYGKWIDSMLAIMPRRWDGFDAAEKIQNYMLYSDTWPAYVRDHWKLYWTAWLMPERETKDLVHEWVEAKKAIDYYQQTGDWRGNTNFYRPYCHNMGTMNFNHTAVTGALLGGAIIGSERVIADGRTGLAQWPLRTWTWLDGSTQESIDHYYFSITLKDQKLFADFGPTPLDRLMGQAVLAKSVDELVGCYHPGLRRFIATSGRTGVAYLFTIQDGTKHIVHTLSHAGALTDMGGQGPGKMPAFGGDAQPGMIAQQTLNGPWAPDWVANTVDEKPLPFEITMNYKMWGGFAQTPLNRRTYMGRNYGMASQDVGCNNETVPLMAQWRRTEQQVERADQLGTLTLRFGINSTNLLDSVHIGTRPDGSQTRNPNGSLGTYGGYPCALQYRNKMIVLTSPVKGLNYPSYPAPEDVRSLQTTIGLFDFQAKPTWELYVDEQRVAAFPVKVKAGQRITLRDGVSFVGIVPLPSTDLGRSDEVVITDQVGPDVEMQGGGTARPALLIEQYLYKSDTSMPKERRSSDEVDLAYGGFVIEMGDATEYPDFAAFQKHLSETALRAEWDAAKKVLNVSYRSGADTMECGYRPDYTGEWERRTPTDQCFPYRRVNGQWPYLPAGIDRDSTLAQQGTTGRLQKGGAVLRSERGRMAYVQTEPTSKTVAGWNPFPDPTLWSLAAPGGLRVEADGKVGMLRAVIRAADNRVDIDHGFRPEDMQRDDLASALLVFGAGEMPMVTLNGQPLKKPLTSVKIGEEQAWVVPLRDAAVDAQALAQRHAKAKAALDAPPPAP